MGWRNLKFDTRPVLRFVWLALAMTLVIGLQTGQATTPEEFDRMRQAFVTQRLTMISDERVKAAFTRVRREQFCLPQYRDLAYADRPLPIDHGQTISQPSLVAMMTEALRLQPDDKVLEIGTGSGFQAAVLAEMGVQVFTIEIIDALAKKAEATLRSEGYNAVNVRSGDGYKGWPEEAPFDAIIVTAAPDTVPQALLDQLRPGSGRLLVPEGPQGPQGQMLRLYRKTADGGVESSDLLPVRFVPMVPGKN